MKVLLSFVSPGMACPSLGGVLAPGISRGMLYSKETHPFFFFFFFYFFLLWSIKLQFDFRVKIWINSHFLQNDSLLYTEE